MNKRTIETTFIYSDKDTRFYFVVLPAQVVIHSFGDGTKMEGLRTNGLVFPGDMGSTHG